jgi:hypothetical protein
MRSLPLPNKSIESILNACVDGLSDENRLNEKYTENLDKFKSNGDEYCKKAACNELHLIDEYDRSIGFELDNGLTGEEIKSLYSNLFSKEGKPARRIYNEIKESAPLNICPYCGCGRVTTLDHFLPKAKYPFFSVLAENLVPSCSDCNHGKGMSNANSAEKQTLHPYYDHALLVTDQWLFASVCETQPTTLMFRAEAPKNWSSINKERIQAHFSSYNLAIVCAHFANVELADRYQSDSSTFKKHGHEMLRVILEEEANNLKLRHKNHWRTAMFQALANSEWYCHGCFIFE